MTADVNTTTATEDVNSQKVEQSGAVPPPEPIPAPDPDPTEIDGRPVKWFNLTRDGVVRVAMFAPLGMDDLGVVSIQKRIKAPDIQQVLGKEAFDEGVGGFASCMQYSARVVGMDFMVCKSNTPDAVLEEVFRRWLRLPREVFNNWLFAAQFALYTWNNTDLLPGYRLTKQELEDPKSKPVG